VQRRESKTFTAFRPALEREGPAGKAALGQPRIWVRNALLARGCQLSLWDAINAGNIGTNRPSSRKFLLPTGSLSRGQAKAAMLGVAESSVSSISKY